MKRYCFVIMLWGLLVNALFAQAPTKLQVSLLNNHFSHVNLTNAYGSSQTNYASVDIKNDKFNMTVNLANDIYKLDFGNGSSMLLVITPGETVNMTLDAENLQQIVSVIGSESMSQVKQMSYLALHRKEAVDSINEALQNDKDKLYWSDFAQKINMYRQSNDDVDNYLLSAFDNLDTLYRTYSRELSNGKLKGNAVFECADAANRMMKKTEIDYTPFANYQENVSRYYSFSGQRVADAQDYYRVFDQYQSDLHSRHQIAQEAIGTLMPKIRLLLAEKDSLAYNNLWDKKGNQSKWVNRVLEELYPSLQQAVGQKAAYEALMKNDKQNADQLVRESQGKVSKMVQKYQEAYNEIDAYLTSRLKETIKANTFALA